MKKLLTILLVLLMTITIFSISKCDKDEPMLSLAYVEWYAITEETEGEFTFGQIRLIVTGFVNTDVDKVTVRTYGDGFIGEVELPLAQPKCKNCYYKIFNADIEIAFTHKAHNKPRRYKTILKAYYGDSTTNIDLQSDWLFYLK